MKQDIRLFFIVFTMFATHGNVYSEYRYVVKQNSNTVVDRDNCNS
jgi:hypothetical protein